MHASDDVDIRPSSLRFDAIDSMLAVSRTEVGVERSVYTLETVSVLTKTNDMLRVALHPSSTAAMRWVEGVIWYRMIPT